MSKDLKELETKDVKIVSATNEIPTKLEETPIDIMLDDLKDVDKGLIPEDFVKDFKKFQKMKVQYEEMEKEIKKKLLKVFEDHPDTIGKHIRDNGLKFTYKVGYTRTSIDSKKLQEEYPKIYEKCKKTTNVNPTILIDIEY